MNFRSFFSRKDARKSSVAADTGHVNQPLSPAFNESTLAVYHWSPPSGYGNFGDEISPMIVQAMLSANGRSDVKVVLSSRGRSKVLAVGSVIHQALDGDIVWGAGINGKSWIRNLEKNRNVNFYAVRGPLTRGAIVKLGLECPEIYGDPGLLFPELFRKEIMDEKESVDRKYNNIKILYIPNLNDDRFLPRPEIIDPSITYVSPNESPFKMAYLVSQAELVISSSLHGLVFADALGIPSRPVVSLFEPAFKYYDYFEGTGRGRPTIFGTISEALQARSPDSINLDLSVLRTSFPIDILPSA